ncbi:MAG: hypothetical protein Q9218_006067 [Villophora microphyllina]
MPALYDTFLVQEPLRQDPFAVTHNPSDHSTLVVVYNKSSDYFAERDRIRAVEKLQYELGRLYMREGEWEEGLKVLKRLWRGVSWRKEGWWELLGLLTEGVRECARRSGDGKVVLEAEWELMSSSFITTSLGQDYDFSIRLGGMEGLEEPMAIRCEDQFPSPCTYVNIYPSLVDYLFGSSVQCQLRESLPVQITITSHAQSFTAPLTLSQTLISFDGGLKNVCIEHKPESESPPSLDDMQVYDIALDTAFKPMESSFSNRSSSSGDLRGACDLRFPPGRRKVISFKMTPRDSGTARVTSITSKLEAGPRTLAFVVSKTEYLRQEEFYSGSTGGVGRKLAGNNGLNEIRIHPKPPKLQIRLPALRKEYLADETATLDIEIVNEEDDNADVYLEARFLGQADAVPKWSWIGEETLSPSSEDPLSDSKATLSKIRLEQIDQAKGRKVQGTFTARSLPTEAVLEIKALYNLVSEPDTPLSKVFIQDIIFDRPFEATYDFQPRVDPDPWPSYFSTNDDEDGDDGKASAGGLRQLWHCTSRLALFASEPLIIDGADLQAIDVPDGTICSVFTDHPAQSLALAPGSSQKFGFQITVQKCDLDDRRSTTVGFQLRIHWRRQLSEGAPAATTTIQCPDLTIPFGEPRVLASIAGPPTQESSTQAPSTELDNDSNGIIPITYTIENPSTHVLNFAVSMDTSDDFAFSGPKATSVTLVPLGRETVRYRIVPIKRGGWITPNLKVLDTGFQQVLRVWPTGEGMRSEKGGAAVWVEEA